MYESREMMGIEHSNKGGHAQLKPWKPYFFSPLCFETVWSTGYAEMYGGIVRWKAVSKNAIDLTPGSASAAPCITDKAAPLCLQTSSANLLQASYTCTHNGAKSDNRSI